LLNKSGISKNIQYQFVKKVAEQLNIFHLNKFFFLWLKMREEMGWNGVWWGVVG
jgi:hypothetical protein